MKKSLKVVYFLTFILFSIKTNAQFCSGSFGSPVVNITFGAGATNPGPQLSIAVPGASTNYRFASYATGSPPVAPVDGDYALVNQVPFIPQWLAGAKDHTGDPNGYMAMFNAAPTPSEFYRQTISNLCPGTTYEFAAWVANVIDPAVISPTVPPNITFKVLDPATQQIIAINNTGNILTSSTLVWNQYGFSFTMPATNSSVTLVLANNNVGGNAQPGNDLAIDDITFRPCGPLTKASFSATTAVDSIAVTSCSNVNLFGKITGSLNIPAYQWQISTDGGTNFINLSGSTALNTALSNLTNGQYQFRFISAEAANINSPNCRFISNTIKLRVTGCSAPTSVPCNNWLKIPNYSTTDYVSIGDLDMIGDKITVEASFAADTNYFIPSTISYDLVSKHTGPSDCNYLLRPVTAEITTTNGFVQIIACDFKPKKINHAALVYDGTTLKFYRNGYLMGSKPASGNLVTNDLITKIGNYSAGSLPGALKGYMNEVRIWNVARTENEIKTYMNAPIPSPVTQAGLVAYYTFDNLNNKQGNSTYNGTLHGSATINNTIPNCAFVADSCDLPITVCNTWLSTPAVNSSVSVGDLDVPGNQITVEATINRTQTYLPGGGNNTEGDVVSKHNDFSDVNYLLRPNHAYITTTNGFFATPDVCDVELNKTYHVALVYNGSTLKFYRDGYLMSQVPATGTLIQNNWKTRIGWYEPQGFTTQFLGFTNEVRIWNVARTQAEINAFMNSSLPSPAAQPGLLAYYQFDNLLNKQGNAAFNGTLNGSATINATNTNCAFVADTCPLPAPCSNWLATPSQPSYVNAGQINITGDKITVEATFNRTTPYTGGLLFAGDLVSKHNTPADANYLLRPNDAEITTSNGYFRTPGTCEIELNKTYHAALVYDGSTLKFYRNGFLLSQVAATGNLFQNTWQTRIGWYEPQGFNTNFIGYINEVRIWNVVKSQAELNTYMNSPLPNPTTQAGLVAYYSFDNLLNKQGNTAFNGTLGGSAVINQTNPNCTLTVDTCTAVVQPLGRSTIINTYTPVVAFDPCDNKIVVEDASTFNIGDTVLLIQMKGAVIDSSNTALFGSVTNYKNAGNYEFNYVKSKTGNVIDLKNVLQYQYDVPQGKVQLIRVPYFQTYAGTDTLTCLPWDGRKGGVLVLNARDSVVLNANIDVKGKGFRGGDSKNPLINTLSCGSNQYFYPNTSTAGAAKGESIYDIGDATSFGKGNNASGGGGGDGHNSGGGGGGNGGSGGFGGYQLEACGNAPFDNRGIGGVALTVPPAANKIFLGGGGGSGHTDNIGGIDMNGGNGGGIAIVITNHFKNNNYKIIADGDSVINCDNTLNNCHDASGGAGSGGTILMQVNNYVNAVNVQSKGGKGGDLVIYNTAGAGRIGPGGGGGGGIIWVSQGSMPVNVNPTLAGGVNGTILADGNNAWGSTPGQAGISKFNLSIPVDTIPFRKNIDSVRIKDSATNCSSFDFKGFSFGAALPATLQWQWTFGDNTGAATQNASHSFDTAGTYNIKLVVTDINGCKDSATKTISTFGAGGDFYYKQDICNPFAVQFFGVNSGNIPGNWLIDSNVFNNNNNPAYIFNGPGNYPIQYIFSNGLCTDTITKLISIGIVPDNIIVTPDTTICFNSTKQLRTVASLDFCWSPVSFLDDPKLANPTTSTPQKITYFFTAAIQGNNLVRNGDFSSGNTGFSSQYISANSNTVPGQYFVSTNPSAWNATLSNCADHTNGSGNMLLVNSDAAANASVWAQTVTVTPNTNYSLSAWLQSLAAVNPAPITFSVNGNDVDTVITANTTTCNWQQFYTTWNAGNTTTATIAVRNKNTQVQGSYFALDDIAFTPILIKRDSVIISIDTPIVKTIEDTSSCRGVQIQLTTTGANTYHWQPVTGLSDSLNASPIASPSDTVLYYVTGTNIHGCSATDSVLVAIKPSPKVLKTADTVICKNAGVQLNVSGGDSYVWRADTTLSNDTIPNPFAKPVTATTYYVQTRSAGLLCEATDSIKVSFKTPGRFTISTPDTVCSKSNVLLTTTGGNVFSWQPANLLNDPTIANPVATPVITTTFTVNIKDSVCGDAAVLSTTINAITLPVIRARKSNDIDCFYLNAKLTASGGNSGYSWTALDAPLYLSDSSIFNPVAFPSRTKTYFVTGADTNTHCQNTDSVQVLVVLGNNPLFWVPNTFTPNADWYNNCFKVYARSRLKYFELYIYNRWGNKVFETKDINDCWDGTYKGQPQDPGNFVYYIRASNDCKDDVTKGNLLLIR